MGCCSSKQITADPLADPTPGPITVDTNTSRQERSGISTSVSSLTLGRNSESLRLVPQIKDVPELPRNRSKSTPEKPPVVPNRSRAKSSPKSSHALSSSRSPSAPVSPELPKAGRPRRPNLTNPSRRLLISSLQEALPEDFKFRILVLGKCHSGKSSLIKTVFKVDTAAAPEKADINAEFRPNDNRYLIVHEFSGLGPQARDSEDLQTIRDFVSRRTEANRTPPERLHAIWICVPASDIIAGRLGDGVKDILALRDLPVVLVITKFDMVVSQVLLDRFSDAPQQLSRARDSAYRMCEGSCRRIFDKEPREVPAEIVSVKASFGDLIENLAAMTDRLITGSTRADAQAGKQRLGAVPLSWSVAVRVNHDISIQASIAIGQKHYWRSPCPIFADQKLKNCVNIIHNDIVEIWNLNDKTGYLLNEIFKAKMSHLVKDLAGSANTTSSIPDWTIAPDDYADWVHDSYRARPENIRCLVGYIVDLTIILDSVFRLAAGGMLPNHVEQVLGRHVRSGRRDAIHRDIRSFIQVAAAYEIKVPQKDLVVEKIIDLIKQYCVPTSLTRGN